MVEAPAQVAPASGSGGEKATLLYFAYGSMCNPVSLSRRGLLPASSRPALLAGYRLAFQLGGMANIVAQPGAACHGVLHAITPAMWAALCQIEASYDSAELQVQPYQPFGAGSSGDAAAGDGGSSGSSGADALRAVVPSGPAELARAFIVTPEAQAKIQEEHPSWHVEPPSERYVRIITEGLAHYGALPAWVQTVAATPFKPSRRPEQYLRLPAPEDSTSLRTWTRQELGEHEARISDDHRAIAAIGRKVIEIDTSARPNAPFVPILASHIAGRDCVYGTCMNLYDPRLPPLSSPADVTAEHVAWAEDMTVEWLGGQGFSVRQIGWLEPESADLN